MFVLKRQDVEISSIAHPKTGQQIPILNYQGQTFRLIGVFNASQAEEARSFWRDLTDNRGKACVLLEEPERFSVWGKVRMDQIGDDGADSGGAATPAFTQASILLLQAVYFDIEDLLGARQAEAFEKEIAKIMQQWKFPQAQAQAEIDRLLDMDPLEDAAGIPPWQEHHLNTLLQELHRIGKDYFGNPNFTERVIDAINDLPEGDRTQFVNWLNQSPLGKLWAAS